MNGGGHFDDMASQYQGGPITRFRETGRVEGTSRIWRERLAYSNAMGRDETARKSVEGPEVLPPDYSS